MNHTTRIRITLVGMICTTGLLAQRPMEPTVGSPQLPVRNGDRHDERADLGIYCTPEYDSGTTVGDWIQTFQLGDLNNISSLGSGLTGYTDYSYTGAAHTVRLDQGGAYQLTIVSGEYDPQIGAFEGFRVWLDENQDGEFTIDEVVINMTTVDPYQLVTSQVQIPVDALPGYTTIRVRNVYNVGDIDPCAFYPFGETEDYTVLINDPIRCIPLYTRGTTDGDYISQVTLGDIAWTQANPATHAYSPNLSFGTQLGRGETHILSLTNGTETGDYFGVWADWNQDGDWEDADEQLGYAPIGTALTAMNFPFTVPVEARVGYTFLRVRCVYGSLPITACSDATFGETKDFTLSVVAGVHPCLPIAGYGINGGDGFSLVELDGNSYNGSTSWPYYRLDASVPYHYEAGSSHTLQITTSTYPEDAYRVFLDMDDDGAFDDAGEFLGEILSTMPNAVLQLPFTLPANCPPGQHILRLKAFDPYNNQSAEGCENIRYGEALDLPIAVESSGGVCIPHLRQWTRYGDFIDGVELGSITNVGTGGAYFAPYNDFTAQSTDVIIGQSYDLTVHSGAYGSDTYYAWLDLNADGDWDDANETLGSAGLFGSFSTAIISFTIPLNTPIGAKRLRLRCADTIQPITACDDSDFGETEDYTVIVDFNTGVANSLYTEDAAYLISQGGVTELITGATWSGRSYRVLDATGRLCATGRLTGNRTYIGSTISASGSYALVLEGAAGTKTLRFVQTAE